MGARIKRVSKTARTAPVHPFDETYGTDTGGLIRKAELATGHASDEHVTAYYAVAPSILEKLIDLWLQTRPPHAIERYTFLDVARAKAGPCCALRCIRFAG